MDAQDLKIKSVIGFNGKIPKSIMYTPDGRYIVFALGTFVVVKNPVTNKQALLDGHSHEVSCIAVSNDGRTLASGQLCHIGVKADVLVWDLSEAINLLENGDTMIGDRCLLYRLMQHLGKVQDLGFSYNDRYLATLGGQDDNALVIWDIDTGSSICGSPAGKDSGLCLQWVHGRDDRLVTGGNYHVSVWQVDYDSPKLHAMEAKLEKIRRHFLSLTISPDDKFAFLGTSTGDVVQVNIERNDILSPKEPDTKVPRIVEKSVHMVAQGAHSIYCFINQKTGRINILVGAGDGSIIMLNSSLKKVAGYETRLMGRISSLAKDPRSDNYTVGTSQCNIYDVSFDLTQSRLLSSCHYGGINDLCFPAQSPELCLTASYGDIRIWRVKDTKEILRIQVPNIDCSCLAVPQSGSQIISGWSDGKIRSFRPESGKLAFVIPDAHDTVTALAIADNDLRSSQFRIITGGLDGKVRVWKISQSHQTMIISLKEHHKGINSIVVNGDSSACVTASADGSCIVWDMNKYIRQNAINEANIFESIVFHPDQSQMITCGSNHKITYWDAADGRAVRVIDGSDNGNMTCLDITESGEFFISGSSDKILKVWHYDNGIAVCKGYGHSGSIKAARISPDERFVASVGTAGEIIFWELPPQSSLLDLFDNM